MTSSARTAYVVEGGCGRAPCMPSQTSPTDKGPTTTWLFDMLDVVAIMLTNNSPPAVINTVWSSETRNGFFVMAAVLPIGESKDEPRCRRPSGCPLNESHAAPGPSLSEHRSARRLLSNSRAEGFMGRMHGSKRV